MKSIRRTYNVFFIGDNIENSVAEIKFSRLGKDVIAIEHTYVSKALRGRGTGLELVNSVVEYAREEKIKIVPVCPFAEKVMVGNKEYEDVLKNK